MYSKDKKYGSYKLPFSVELIDEEGNLKESDLLSVM